MKILASLVPLHFALFCVGSILCAATGAFASTADTPEAQAYIEKYGIKFPFDHEQEIIALYSGILVATKHGGSQLQTARGLHYGSDARNRLDVHYTKKSGGMGLPIVIFFHGGGFVSGDTQISGAIYDNVANYFARRGVVAINATYRLAPKDRWPSGIEDVAAAVEWTRAHGAEFGGNPNKIFLMGHSAGATHVAGYIFSEPARQNQSLAGAILISGAYMVPESGNSDIYFGSDTTKRSVQSPLNKVDGSSPIPTMVAFAEYDPAGMQFQSVDLIRRICGRDERCPRIVQIVGHNHMSEIFHFDTADQSGASDILAFIQSVAARTGTR